MSVVSSRLIIFTMGSLWIVLDKYFLGGGCRQTHSDVTATHFPFGSTAMQRTGKLLVCVTRDSSSVLDLA